MRIALNASHAVEPHTGVGVYCIELIRALVRIDADMTFDVFAPRMIPELEGVPRVRVIVPPERYASIEDFNRNFTRSSVFNAARYDLVHVLFFKAPVGYAKLPMVYTVHDIIPTIITALSVITGRFPAAMYSLYGLRSRFLDRAVIRAAHGIIAISDATRSDIIRAYKVPASRISVAENGVREHGAHSRAALKKYTLAARRYFIYFGGHTVRKNVVRLAEAFSLLPEEIRRTYPLVITGTGATEREARRRFPDGIRYVGRLPDEELWPLVAHAYAAVYPSLYEGFGLPILEAALYGVPTITSNTSAMKDVIPGATMLIDPRSPASIAEAMHALVTDTRMRNRLGLLARRRARAYRWENTARSVAAAYRAAVSPAAR